MRSNRLLGVAGLVMVVALHSRAPAGEVADKLGDFDAYMARALKEWNLPGIGVGIVAGDQLVYARGFGYRDYGEKLPFTPTTLMPIASNSKLFTAVAAGMLVQDGSLAWDEPIRKSVPAIEFFNDELNSTVTLRDMLSHRTGITRHDLIWYKSPFSREDLFSRLRHMEPKVPIRENFLYNNMMYAAVGHVIELETGSTWEEFVQERIFEPLGMNSTVFTVAEMLESADHGVPYTERRDTDELYRIPYYEDTAGVAPAGAIISNIEELSHWLIALMNDGRYKGQQVLPSQVLRETLNPAIALGNSLGESRGFWELLNQNYGMGRFTASYRGHLLTYHGGDLPAFHSQVSFMPLENIGVIVFVIGDHAASLYNVVTYEVYERLVGLEPTPWSERWLSIVRKSKEAGTEARAKAGADRVSGTTAAHPLEDYAGDYENPAYGILGIGLQDGQLRFRFHAFEFPMTHYHFERFDTPDDERDGKWSVNFQTNPQGDVDKATMSLDEAEAVFTRRPPAHDRGLLAGLAGSYESATGYKFEVALKESGELVLLFPGQPEEVLFPYKGLQFRLAEFADLVFEFVVEGGRATSLKQRDPSGEYLFTRK